MRTEDTIRAVLLNRDILQEKAYRGDYDALTLLLDLDDAIASADLTDRQRSVIHCMSYEYMSQAEIARHLGVTQPTVSITIRKALTKLARQQQGELTT